MDAGRVTSGWIVATATLLLAACAGREARDFAGRWGPANAWAATAVAVPLHPPYVFQATPMDGSLRALLARWARDHGGELDYRHTHDFTLHAPVAGVRAVALADAVAQLGTVFAGEGVDMRVEGDRIVVLVAARAGHP